MEVTSIHNSNRLDGGTEHTGRVEINALRQPEVSSSFCGVDCAAVAQPLVPDTGQDMGEDKWKYPCHRNVFVIFFSGSFTTSETSVTGYSWQWEMALDGQLAWPNVSSLIMFIKILSLSHSSIWVDMCNMIHANYSRIAQSWATSELTRFSRNEEENASHFQQSDKAVFRQRELKLPLIPKFSSGKRYHIEK